MTDSKRPEDGFAATEQDDPADLEVKRGEVVVDAEGTQLIADASGELVPLRMETPIHGQGLLRRGNPGNKGGGRKPDEVKRHFLELAHTGQMEVARRLQAENVRNMTDSDLAKFLDVFGKYSVGTKHTLTGPDDGPLKHGIMALPPLENDQEDDDGEPQGDDS